ncbi:MAG: OmpH family outer membrane protein [Ignavibacteria bacterium]|jgi:outer membrane protein
MKFRILISAVILLISSCVFSQEKIGYVDSKIIIDGMEDAKDAQKNLDNLVSGWKSQIQQLDDSLKTMKDDYEKKKLILTENIKKQREDSISTLEKRIADFQLSKFGENGEYFQKQNELMKPVQDKVFKAIQDVAKEGGYDFVFDRSSELTLLYMNDKYDLTQKVIRKLENK